MAKSLWVLIAAAGKPQLLARTLTSLASVRKPPSYRGTLIVENGPRCGIETVVRQFPTEHRFAHLYVPEGNKSHALNCGLQLLDYGLVFMTDDDVRFDPEVLVAYDDAAKGTEQGEFYGGQVRIDAEHGLPPAWMWRYYSLTIAQPWSLGYNDRTVVENRTFMGTNWAAFAGDLVAAGGFDSRFGPGSTTGATGQETEAQHRLLANGRQSVYVPQASVWHHLHREYLDPQWVLKRTYRHGLEWGIRQTRGKRSTSRLLAHSALRRWNAHAKGFALRLFGREQWRFAADFYEAKWSGRWEGMKLGQHWEDVPRISPVNIPGGLHRAA